MNKNNIIIVGAGGLGREIYSWLVDAGLSDLLLGFINDLPNSLNDYEYPMQILGDIENHAPIDGVDYLMAIMSPADKKKVAFLLKNRGCKFTKFIHPAALIGQNVKLGEGVVITPGCILTCDIEVEDFVFLNTQTTLGHDVKIGAYTSINGKVEISGFVEIGEEVTIGSRVVVLHKKKVISGANIGAGSVVVGNINKPITVFGNPAKRIS